MDGFKDKIEKQAKESQELLALMGEFPDLREYQGRWHTYKCSKKVNTMADKVHFVHGCGCCSDSPLYIMPYIKIGEHIIYSDPAQICIGEGAGMCAIGERPDEDWQEIIAKHNINPDLIPIIQKYFDDHPVEYLDDE